MEILTAPYVLPIDQTPWAPGAVVIEGATIVEVGPQRRIVEKYSQIEPLDFPHHVLMPGLVNSHCHLDQTNIADFASDPVRSAQPFFNYGKWLYDQVKLRQSKPIREIREAIAKGLEQLANSGVTLVGDMSSCESIFDLIEESRMRAVIFPEVISFDPALAKDIFESALAIVEKYTEDESDKISVGIGPYSAFTLSRHLLKIVAQHCSSSELPVMIHAAETFSEMEFFFNSTGPIATHLFPNIGWGDNLPPPHQKTPIEYLAAIDFLRARPILVGGIHLTDRDLDLIAEHRCPIVICPQSHYYLKQPKAPLAKMFERQIIVGLGTDGIASNRTLSLWEEMRFAYELYNGGGSTSDTLDANTLLTMATLGGAKILGLADEVGSLTAGKQADLIAIDIKNIPEPERANLPKAILTHVKDYHVSQVWVAGEVLKRQN